jgi:hypothetical protein
MLNDAQVQDDVGVVHCEDREEVYEEMEADQATMERLRAGRGPGAALALKVLLMVF